MDKKPKNINNWFNIISMLVLGWIMTGYAISERIITTNENANRDTSMHRDVSRVGNSTASEFGNAPRNLGAEYSQWLSGALRDGTVERN